MAYHTPKIHPYWIKDYGNKPPGGESDWTGEWLPCKCGLPTEFHSYGKENPIVTKAWEEVKRRQITLRPDLLVLDDEFASIDFKVCRNYEATLEFDSEGDINGTIYHVTENVYDVIDSHEDIGKFVQALRELREKTNVKSS